MADAHPETATRVLVYAPVGRDAALTRELLSRAAIEAVICLSIDQLVHELGVGAGAVILTEEVFESPGFQSIVQRLEAQPPWSDIAVLLFAGAEDRSASPRTIQVLDRLPNVTLLERPIRIAVAVSIIRAALRARRRQLEVRDLLVALDDARSAAETANRLKDEFLATLSHELRTPLNAILGWTAMLRHGRVDSTRMQRGLEVIDRNAQAQAQLVEDVLDTARVITGKLRLELQPVAITGIVDAAVEALRPAADAKGITLEVARRTDPPLVRGDAHRLQQVFWNLLSNAVKFTPEGGEIQVRIDSPDSQVRVMVKDTGIGLEPQFLPFVFDRFRQADQSTTRGHGGLGLGLALVKHLVELHGGRVEVQSDGPSRGSTFIVVLPIPAVLLTRDAKAREDVAPFGLQFPGRTVLVVDDDAATRELLGELFDEAMANVATADSAAAAYAAVTTRQPDVIIADIGLPGEDGISLIRRIRAIPGPAGRVPAIALSAYTRSEDRETARNAGFSDFIGKPAAPQDLLTAVHRLLASPVKS